MFCEKCGTKNESGSKFCEKCGNKLTSNSNTNESAIAKKIKAIPKKTKSIIGIIALLVVILIIVLVMIFNDPVSKFEDSLNKYYETYSTEVSDDTYLKEIGDILYSNKDDADTLSKIDSKLTDAMKVWKNAFNVKYDSLEDLDEAYEKLSGALSDLYSYLEDLEFLDYDLISYEEYYEYYDEVSSLDYSKYYYLYGSDSDDYYKYYYYLKVIESDCYYSEAQEFVSSYISDTWNEVLEEIEELVTVSEDSTNKEKYENYLEVIEYLNDNGRRNSLELSETEDYKSLYNEYSEGLYIALKAYIEESDEDIEYIVDMIEDAVGTVSSSASNYSDFESLLEDYEDKLPVMIGKLTKVNSTNYVTASTYSYTVDDESYEGYIRFRLVGETQSITYSLDGAYSKFTTKIIIDDNWDEDYEGTIIIYGDDEELYNSKKIDANTQISDIIEIDVTGVSTLKIEFVTESGNKGLFSGAYLYIVEPYVYK